jgi:pimeloyl-ACP methyl ester carboxylesterase
MTSVDLHHAVEGSGPPLLLLHGSPQTHVCWDAVVERFQSDFTLVRPDLRGYGDSPKPEGDDSKRTMAADVLALMRRLGHERFAVAGHDRGVLVGQRLALEHPGSVSHLAVLDNVPVLEMWESIAADAALGAYHLFFLAQPPDLPERLLAGDPAAFVDSFLDGWTAVEGAISEAARRSYQRAFARPETIRAVCDDYRAGATVDLAPTAPTAPPDGASPPRCSRSGRSPAGPLRPSTHWRSGGDGPTTSRATVSTAATSSPRSDRTRSPRRSAT